MKDEKVLDNARLDSELVSEATERLDRYVQGKRSVDQKATENQEWWKVRHWSVAQDQNEDVGSAWAFNSLINKHADIMDALPKPNILPREADDEEEAETLTSIIPSILEQNDYEEVYREMGWDICIDGAAITGVFWDKDSRNGQGDIAITNVDVHNLFWEPGIDDIQDSDYVYHVSLEDADKMKAMYPDIASKIGPQDTGRITKYVHDDDIDTTKCVEVINMYSKKTYYEPVYLDDDKLLRYSPKTVLHLVIIVGNELVFNSEDIEGYENGFYHHGKYPFVIRRIFSVKDSPWGFGYLDIMKRPQRDIDKLDQAIIKNTMMKSRPRYWARKNGNINVSDFADWSKEIVEVGGSGSLGESVERIQVDSVPGGTMQHLVNKIDELKETSGNRDFSQGSTASGVTAASAIAALQEAGSKLSRDINKELYRGSREEYYLIIELIRQFYDEERSFRVDDPMGGYTFTKYSNKNLVGETLPGGEVRHRKSIFDITVSAEKQSPFSRAAQNETAKELYSMGMFVPNNSIPALACIDMMDFEGKEAVKQQIQQNSQFHQQLQIAMQFIQQATALSPQLQDMAMQMGVMQPQMEQAEIGRPHKDSPEDRASKVATDNSYASKIRKRSAEAASPF